MFISKSRFDKEIEGIWDAIECESKKIEALHRRIDRKDVELLSNRIARLENKKTKL